MSLGCPPIDYFTNLGCGIELADAEVASVEDLPVISHGLRSAYHGAFTVCTME